MNDAKLTALAERVANLNPAAGEIGAGMLAQLVDQAQDALKPVEGGDTLQQIRERWASRKWPTIGYFVHGQAYEDIQTLLRMIAYYKNLAHVTVGKPKDESPTDAAYQQGATHCLTGLRAVAVNLTRYNADPHTANMYDDERGEWLKRSDVLELLGVDRAYYQGKVTFGHRCDTSPVGHCEYEDDDVCQDRCIHCGDPYERK